MLLPQIKAELKLSDTAIGVMSGAGFAVFYTTLGFPIARLADRGGRKWIITVCLAAFSAMTVLCGLAQNGWQLFAGRIGVAVGEAGTNPSSFAMIGDTTPQERRSHAMAVLSAGANVGVLLGFVAGGIVAARFGWRMGFAAVGLPGLLLALAAAVLLPAGGARTAREAGAPGFGSTLRTLMADAALRNLTLGAGLVLFSINAVNVWLPSLLSRAFHLPTQRISLFMGLALGLGGLLGTLLLSGRLVDGLGRRDARWPAWFVAILAPATALLLLPVLYAPNGTLALILFIGPASVSIAFQAPTLALIQSRAPVSMRATANAAFLFVANLIGLGLGPFVVGALSDLYAAHGLPSALALRGALLTVIPVGFWAAGHYLLAARALRT